MTHLDISPEDTEPLDKLITMYRVLYDILYLPLPGLLGHLAGVRLYAVQGSPQVTGIVLHLLQEQPLLPHQPTQLLN